MATDSSYPSTWALVQLGELVVPSKERFTPIETEEKIFIGLAHIESNSGKIIGKSSSLDTKSLKTVFHSGDILYGRLRPYLNKVSVPEFDGVCSTDILVFNKSRFFSSKYFAFFLLTPSFVEYTTKNMSGVQHPRVKFDVISKFLVPFPPYNEQIRIVSKIEELFSRLDQGVKDLQKTQQQLEQYQQSTIQQAFTGKLTQKWRKKNHDIISDATISINESKEYLKKYVKRTTLEKVSYKELGELPLTWNWIQIGEISYLINGRAFKPKEWSNEGLPIVRIKNLNDHNAIFNYCNFKVKEKYYLKNGDLLFAWSGTPGTSFGAHIWKRGRAVLNQHIYRIVINEDYLDKIFFKFLINYNVNDYIRRAHGSAGLAHITKKEFENSSITLPSYEEQIEIRKKLEQIEVIVQQNSDVLNKEITHSNILKQSILKKAFEGRLVPQDPKNESASVLLERIKVEKTKIEPIRRRAREHKKRKGELSFQLTPVRSVVIKEKSKELF